MSVLMLDTPVYNYLRAGIETAAYRSVCDEWYFYTISSHFKDRDIEKESVRLVKSWCDLNEKSYNGKYKQDECEPISKLIRHEFTHKPLTPLQFLKYIQCLIYNIELEHFTPTEQETEDFKLLQKLELDVMKVQINQLKEYKDASWSN